MKLISIIILLLISVSLSAQDFHYNINGSIKGNSEYKYVMLYSEGKRLEKLDLKDNKFEFSGMIKPRGRFGDLTLGSIYLVSQDLPENFQPIYPKGVIKRNIIFEPDLTIVFNISDRTSQVIKGKDLNKVQNVFAGLEEKYAKKLDSAYHSIANQNLDSVSEAKEKKQIKRALFIEQKQSTLETIRQYPNSEASLMNFIPFAMVPFFTNGQARETFNVLADSIRNSRYGKRLDSMLTDLDKKMVKPKMKGLKMPGFVLKDAKGEEKQGNSLFGKYTLIDFWASWCSPCRAENPNLKLALDTFHDKGLNIISISIDQAKDKEKWLAAIKKDKTESFINLLDPSDSATISKELNINAIPANFLVDANGYIVETDLRGADLQRRLKELFK